MENYSNVFPLQSTLCSSMSRVRNPSKLDDIRASENRCLAKNDVSTEILDLERISTSYFPCSIAIQ